MPRKNHKIPKKIYLMSAIVILGTIGGIGLIVNDKSIGEIVLEQKQNDNPYPSMYQGRQISQNAIESNPKYRNIPRLRSDSLLANTVSIVKRNEYLSKNGDPEHGTWLWTNILDITPEYRDRIISGAKRNGIKNIYVSIDSYLDIYVMDEGEEKNNKQKAFDNILREFIKKAKENGITVDAEAGWRNWAENGHTYKAFAVLDYAIEFNKKYEEKFRGFQFDIEPYILPNFEKDKKKILSNFVNLIDESTARLSGSDLEFTVVIPEFYDSEDDITPKFMYARSRESTLNHLLKILDRRPGSKIIVMAYRNWSLGENGTIDISMSEITEANNYQTKIIIAQETGNVEPHYITFYNTSRRHFDRQLTVINDELRKELSFGGTAVHFINSFMELR